MHYRVTILRGQTPPPPLHSPPGVRREAFPLWCSCNNHYEKPAGRKATSDFMNFVASSTPHLNRQPSYRKQNAVGTYCLDCWLHDTRDTVEGHTDIVHRCKDILIGRSHSKHSLLYTTLLTLVQNLVISLPRYYISVYAACNAIRTQQDSQKCWILPRM